MSLTTRMVLRGLGHQCSLLGRISFRCNGTYTFTHTASSQNVLLPEIPELFNPKFLDELIPATHKDHASPTPKVPLRPVATNPMMGTLRQWAHRTYTENNAPAYSSTLSATLDAFQHLTRFAYGEKVGEYLEKAWAEDPDLTLRIVWNLRSIHDGKAEKEVFYRAFGWLYDNHPRTAITNLHLLVEPVCVHPQKEHGLTHGYWKDLLNILALATVDELSNVTQPPTFLHNQETFEGVSPVADKKLAAYFDGVNTSVKSIVKARRAAVGVEKQARIERKLSDPKYRALYVAVARLFSERLLADIYLLMECETAESADARQTLLKQISLAPKWAPTLRASHDRCTNISTAISRLLHHSKDAVPGLRFPSALNNCPTDLLRSFYRRWFLTSLRSATDIKYNRVSSICMKNNTELFFKHDPEGFQKYLVSVEKGTKTISGATLMPHELVAQIVALGGPQDTKYPELQNHRQELAAVQLRVIEVQWKTLVQNLRDSGAIENSVAICDVSGSMGSLGIKYDSKRVQPIFPSVALSLLLAQLAKPPFNDGFITFSARPKFVRLDPARPLYDTVTKMERAEWGMNTDLNAVFLKLILPLAIKNKVQPADMIKRLFKAFCAAGYEVPQIVYWNLSHYGTAEVMADRTGVAMMSGFSPSMLKVFMGGRRSPGGKGQGGVQPSDVMKKALQKESYSGLVVVD
ncbi:hypothetical protein B0H10DRAFT_2082511 [Mycena sp. CBHHK59/15]|nr:hypothetical protein B0H10DRAFT_2082511 [Mycena sp. CBHHK59/15]